MCALSLKRHRETNISNDDEYEKWPDCVEDLLIKAETLQADGRYDEGV